MGFQIISVDFWGIVTRVLTLVFFETNRFLVSNRMRSCFFSNIYIYTIALSIYIYNSKAPGVGCRVLHFDYDVHSLGLRPKLGLWTGIISARYLNTIRLQLIFDKKKNESLYENSMVKLT